MKEKCFNHGYYVMVRFKADKSGYNKSTQFQDIVQTVEFPPIEYKSRIIYGFKGSGFFFHGGGRGVNNFKYGHSFYTSRRK